MPARGSARVERPAGSAKTGWAAMLAAVRTPLGFFTLVVLIIESFFTVLVPQTTGGERIFLIAGMFALIFALVAVVAFLAYKSPGALNAGAQSGLYSIFIGVPVELPTLDITKIEWNDQECFIVADQINERVKLVPSRVGPTYRVQLSDELVARIGSDCVRLRLKDALGNRWHVRPFYLFETVMSLSLGEKKEKIVDDYSE